MRDWVTNADDTHYTLARRGSTPLPYDCRDGSHRARSKRTVREAPGRLTGRSTYLRRGGSGYGMFYPFLEDTSVRLVGVEAGGDGVATG